PAPVRSGLREDRSRSASERVGSGRPCPEGQGVAGPGEPGVEEGRGSLKRRAQGRPQVSWPSAGKNQAHVVPSFGLRASFSILCRIEKRSTRRKGGKGGDRGRAVMARTEVAALDKSGNAARENPSSSVYSVPPC